MSRGKDDPAVGALVVEQLRHVTDELRVANARLAELQRAGDAPTHLEPSDFDPNATYDRLGRKAPTQGFTALTFIRAIPGLAAHFAKAVPGEFVALDVDRGEPCAVIACPCGSEPRVRANRINGCACERYFLFDGDTVFVASFEERTS